jgi:hypothetical protein
MRKLSIIFLTSLLWAPLLNSAANDPILNELIAKNAQATQAAQCLDVSKQALLSQWTETYRQAIQSQSCPVNAFDSDSIPLPGTVAEDEDLRQAAKLVKGQLNLEHCLNAGQRLQYYDWRKEQANLPANDKDCTQAKKPSPPVIPQPQITPKAVETAKTTTSFPTVLASSPLGVRSKPQIGCQAYVMVMQHDEVTGGLWMVGLNKSQYQWWKKHGNKGDHKGICYLGQEGESQQSLEWFRAHPTMNLQDTNRELPVYFIIWGEHQMSRPYTVTTEMERIIQGTVTGEVTDQYGEHYDFHATTSTTVPVTKTESGVAHYYVADGLLFLWDPTAANGAGKAIPLEPLHGQELSPQPDAGIANFVLIFHNRTASVSILEHGLQAIRKLVTEKR